MVDRQDIDALLIGALYGELTPADETRLASHLESHPADRSALDGLKAARQAVRESRFFELQLEPPQQISALLLQEAHRRAPRSADKESWLARFMRSFMAHPAMAAAAMLVLVLGVAGTLYLRGSVDQQLEEKTAMTPSTPAVANTVATSDAAELEHEQGSGSGSGIGSAFEVGVVNDELRAKLSEVQAPAPKAPPKVAVTAKPEPPKPTTAHAAVPKAPSKKSGIVVSTKDYAPKELPDTEVVNDGDAYNYKKTASPGGGGTVANATTGAGPAAPSGKFAKGEMAPPPPQAAPPPAAMQPTKPADMAPASGSKAAARADAPAQSADPNRQWAVSQHATARSYAANGNCSAAAKIALAVANRAPDYFAAEMADDRALKSCKVYIDAERTKDAEKNAKSRAQKRVNANEASPAPSMDSH